MPRGGECLTKVASHAHMHAITYPTIITVPFYENKLLHVKNHDIKSPNLKNKLRGW